MNPLRWTFFLVFAVAVSGCGSSGPARPDTQPRAAAATPAAAAAAPFATQDAAALYLNVIGGLLEQQHYGAALAFLDDYALRQKDPEPRYWLLRGNALQGSGRGDEADGAYMRLAETDLAAEGWNGRGRVAAASQHWQNAQADFEKAVEVRPANAQFLNNLAFAMMHLGQGASSVFHFRQAHELDPGSSLIRNNLIIALDLAGDTTAADQLLGEIRDTRERDTVREFVHRKTAGTEILEASKS